MTDRVEVYASLLWHFQKSIPNRKKGFPPGDFEDEILHNMGCLTAWWRQGINNSGLQCYHLCTEWGWLDCLGKGGMPQMRSIVTPALPSRASLLLDSPDSTWRLLLKYPEDGYSGECLESWFLGGWGRNIFQGHWAMCQVLGKVELYTSTLTEN